MHLIVYLDEILIMNISKDSTKADVDKVVELLQSLGFLMNWEKSIVEPSHVLEYLGLVINSVKLFFHYCRTRLQQLRPNAMLPWPGAKFHCGRCVDASIIGNLTWAIPTIPFAQSHFRRMQELYIKQASKVGFNLKSECLLSAENMDDLEWDIPYLTDKPSHVL